MPFDPYSWTSENLVARLVKRFLLQKYPIAPDKSLIMSHTIQPVTQIDRILQTLELEGATKTIGSSGWATVHTVPDDERWNIIAYQVYESSGNYEIEKQRVYDGTYHVPIDEWTAADRHVHTYSQLIPIAAGWTIDYEIVNYVAGGQLASFLLVWKEKDFEEVS